MKKIVLLCFTAVLLETGVGAQVYIQAGLNLANITKTSDGQTEKNNVLPTFNAGILGRFNLSSAVDLESGLLISGQGSRAETYFLGSNDYVKSRFNPVYLQVPLNAVFKIPLEKNTALFINTGPYIAMGITGKSKIESKIGPLVTSSSQNIKFSNDDPFTSKQDDAAYNKLKRFDFGINAGGGIEFKHLILKVNYGLGFAKINSTESNNNANDKNKYRTISFSAGIPL